MPTTFQKRQKEMKRMEKRQLKEERRAQRKLDKQTENVTAPEKESTGDSPEHQGSVE